MNITTDIQTQEGKNSKSPADIRLENALATGLGILSFVTLVIFSFQELF